MLRFFKWNLVQLKNIHHDYDMALKCLTWSTPDDSFEIWKTREARNCLTKDFLLMIVSIKDHLP